MKKASTEAKKNLSSEEIDLLLRELIEFQQNVLLKCGRRFIPHITQEDLLQPNDYHELEFNPHFRYEEGVLAGIQTVQTAIMALKKR